jgi:hypothetical protein
MLIPRWLNHLGQKYSAIASARRNVRFDAGTIGAHDGFCTELICGFMDSQMREL